MSTLKMQISAPLLEWKPKIHKIIIWTGWCKNSLSDDFGPPFRKPQDYLLSCDATVAKGIMLCSQQVDLVICMEFQPKHYQVTLLLTRKEKLPKCQEIPVIALLEVNNTSPCGRDFFLKKTTQKTGLSALEYL